MIGMKRVAQCVVNTNNNTGKKSIYTKNGAYPERNDIQQKRTTHHQFFDVLKKESETFLLYCVKGFLIKISSLKFLFGENIQSKDQWGHYNMSIVSFG